MKTLLIILVLALCLIGVFLNSKGVAFYTTGDIPTLVENCMKRGYTEDQCLHEITEGMK